MAVRLLYTASNYLRKCCLTCTHLLKMSPESSRVLTTLIFFLFAPFPLGLESRGFFIFCQRSVKISKYCISPSVRIASNVGLEKDSYQWKNVCSSPVVVVVMMYCTMSLFNPLSWHFGVINMEVESFDDSKVSVWVHLFTCFLNQPHSRLLPILVWLSYWPLSSTCSCSRFAFLLLQPLDVFVCFLHLSQLDHLPHPPQLPTVRPHQQAFFKDTWLWSACLWAFQASVCNDVVAAAGVCLFTFRSHLEFISDVFASRESLAETHHTHIYACPVFVFSSISPQWQDRQHPSVKLNVVQNGSSLMCIKLWLFRCLCKFDKTNIDFVWFVYVYEC